MDFYQFLLKKPYLLKKKKKKKRRNKLVMELTNTFHLIYYVKTSTNKDNF